MAIECVTHRILVRPFDVRKEDPKLEAARRLGIEIVGDQLDREQKGVDKGVVVSWGPTAFRDMNTDNPLKVGDEIVYAKYAGKELVDPVSKETFVALNDEDIIAILRS